MGTPALSQLGAFRVTTPAGRDEDDISLDTVHGQDLMQAMANVATLKAGRLLNSSSSRPIGLVNTPVSSSMNSTSALPQSPLLPPRVRLGPAYGTFLICTFLSLMYVHYHFRHVQNL